jgi:hypothetical protein
MVSLISMKLGIFPETTPLDKSYYTCTTVRRDFGCLFRYDCKTRYIFVVLVTSCRIDNHYFSLKGFLLILQRFWQGEDVVVDVDMKVISPYLSDKELN